MLGPDRRAVDLERRLRADPRDPAGATPVADPALAAGAVRDSTARASRVVLGRVADAFAYSHTYRVVCEGAFGQVRCAAAAHTALNLSGARDLATYRPGAQVLVLLHPGLQFGLILCAVPDYGVDASHGLGDVLVSASGVGVLADAAHRTAASTGGVIDFSAGRPLDSLPVGEWGAISESGLRVLLDPFHVQVGLDELTGLSVFLFDQLARLSGRNLQVRSAAHERDDVDDQGEFSSWSLWTPYLFEAAGGRPGGDDTTAATGFAGGDVSVGAREPKFARGAYRQAEFRGYLGQGGHRLVGVPTPGGTPEDADAAATGAALVQGAFAEFRSLDGGAVVRTAHSYVIAKTPFVPFPRQKRVPADAAGDGPVPAGVQEVAGWVVADAAGGDDNLADSADAAAVFDAAAYAWAWKGNHPFRYKPADWALDTEERLAAEQAAQVPPFGDLASHTFLPRAASFQLDVDERYGPTEYYLVASLIALLPGGGISIVDGAGSEIRLAGGTILEACAGDHIRMAGRDTVDLAGWDAVVMGHNCVDVSAAHAAVRVKAETDLLLLSGNSGCGGTLIENRGDKVSYNVDPACPADAFTGVIVRAAKASVQVFGADIALDVNSLADPYHTNQITFNAGVSGSVFACADQFRRVIGSHAIDFFVSTNLEAAGLGLTGVDALDVVVHEYWANQVRFNCDLVVKGDAVFGGLLVSGDGLWAGGNVVAADHRILDAGIAQTLTNTFTALAARKTEDFLVDTTDRIDWYAKNTQLLAVQFYFREAKYLLTANYCLHAPVWHQMARAAGQSLPGWSEPQVDHPFRPASRPWPGDEAWANPNGYGDHTTSLFDFNALAAADGTGEALDPTLTEVSWVTLGEGILIVADSTGGGGPG